MINRMEGMAVNRIAKILSAVTIALLAAVIYTVSTAQLTAVSESIVIQPVTERMAAFESLQQAIEEGDLADNQFRLMPSEDPEDYCFVNYTVTLSGRCPLVAEWAVLSISPAEGDIAFLPGEAQDVAPFGGKTLTGTLITMRENAEQNRILWVEYYVFGRGMSATIEGA